MKVGFVGSANTTIRCRPDRSFRLASYSKKRVLHTIESNLQCIQKTIDFNAQNNLYCYRIADFIPFISHPISISWQEIEDMFSDLFVNIGKTIRKHKMRISMHPGQYTIINSPKHEVVEKSLKELEASTWILDKLQLNKTAKVQIHIGGFYGNKAKALERFIRNFNHLAESIKKRLVIENDDRLFDFKDCLDLSTALTIPVVFDVFHHSIKNNNESIMESLNILKDLWKTEDGNPMADWSSQEPEARIGRHASTIDLNLFKKFIYETEGMDFDLVLEIRDKEKSAIKAASWLHEIGRI
ncbi:MAG: UV DNA damage repair endonuclease UvsE [Candidatus Hodarchaeales archaeon]|jgi:UV DNA damage endonuclease